MKKHFVDTNFFLRFLIGDSPDQAKEARDFFADSLRLNRKLISSVVVLFEIYWILNHHYGIKEKRLVDSLLLVLKLSVDFGDDGILLDAVLVMSNYGYDLEDSYNVIFARRSKVDKFATFDKKLLKKFGGGDL